MWSSYRKFDCGQIAFTVVLVAGAVSAGTAAAAEIYTQPGAEAREEVDSNRNLVTTGSNTTGVGYGVNLVDLVGIATPLSTTTLRPQIGYVDFPKDQEHSLIGQLDLASTYNSPRSGLALYGTFNHSDTYLSELANAQFNPVVPVSPTTPETARVTTNTTRTLGNVVPKYDWRLTQQTSIGVSGVYEHATYSGDFASLYVPYEYRQGDVHLAVAMTPRMDLSVGPFVSRDAAKRGGLVSDGEGAKAGLEYKWSRTFSGTLELTGERDSTRLSETAPTSRSNNFGATYATTWTGQTSSFRLSAGRTFSPNGAGGIYRTDQLQAEFDHRLSDRISTSYAARYIDARALVGAGADNYKYGEAIAGIKWLLTRTWYLSGGAQFQWVRYGLSSSSGKNAMAYVSVGYQGLGPRT
jgi:hypothetical protein